MKSKILYEKHLSFVEFDDGEYIYFAEDGFGQKAIGHTEGEALKNLKIADSNAYILFYDNRNIDLSKYMELKRRSKQ